MNKAVKIAAIIIIALFVIGGVKIGKFLFTRSTNGQRESREVQGIILDSEKRMRENPAGDAHFTILLENYVNDRHSGLIANQGISILVEKGNRKFLLDVGPHDEFIKNAAVLEKRVADADFVFISHNHLDHSGGLGRFLEKNGKAPVYMSGRATGRSYFVKLAGVFKKEISGDAGLPAKYPGRFIDVDKMSEISPGVFVIPKIEEKYPMPVCDEIVYSESKGEITSNDFTPEQVLVIKEKDGLVIFSGCCHHGVLNMIYTVNKYFPGVPVKAMIGGFHLSNPVLMQLDEDPRVIEQLGKKLAESGVKRFITGHCTGVEAFNILKKSLGDRLEYFSTGMEFNL